MLTLTCQRCEHQWEYTGESQHYATCPDCKTSVKVEGGGSRQRDTSETSREAPATVELATGDMVREVEVVEAVEEIHEAERELGEAQEGLRQRVVEVEDELAQRRQAVREVAAILKELIDGMGGEVEYGEVELETADVEGLTPVQEAAAEVEIEG